ncbi:MAG: ABC transporter permease [Ignavibacteriales bacterium]|nr:ABC transporter permease [Ignavibacteriales bacterium]
MKFWEISEGLQIAFTAIKANKLRSMLTTLGIVIGIVSVTLMATAIEGLNRWLDESVSKIGADVLYVQKMPWFSGNEWWRLRNRKDLTLEQANALERQVSLVSVVSPFAGSRSDVRRNDKVVEGILVAGVDEKYYEVSGMAPEFGRFISAEDAEGARPVVVLGYDVADKLFLHQNAIDQQVKIRGESYRVIGVLEKQGSFLGMSLDNRVLIPIKKSFNVFGGKQWVTISAKVAPGVNIDDAKEEIRGIMRKVRHVKPGDDDDFAINQQELMTRTFDSIAVVIYGIGLFITGMSLFVGAIGIMNIMFVSVTERTKEIGIRKAIGAKRRTILFQFLIEAATLCLIGGIIGIAVAFPISFVINEFLPTAMPLSVVAVSLIVSATVGLISGILPANKASKLDPVDALRYE